MSLLFIALLLRSLPALAGSDCHSALERPTEIQSTFQVGETVSIPRSSGSRTFAQIINLSAGWATVSWTENGKSYFKTIALSRLARAKNPLLFLKYFPDEIPVLPIEQQRMVQNWFDQLKNDPLAQRALAGIQKLDYPNRIQTLSWIALEMTKPELSRLLADEIVQKIENLSH